MKNIVASVGLVALGATGLQVGSVFAQTVDVTKPWSVGISLRGFYDDNINDVHRNTPAYQDAFGYDAEPTVGFAWTTEQTRATANYTYTFRYYDHRPIGNTENYDQNHNFSLMLDHMFNPRYHINVKDSFVVGQDPDFLRAGNTFTVFQRVPGNNIRNYGGLTFDAQVTREFSVQAGYDNAYYDYADHNGTAAAPSLSGTQDRIEQRAHLDGRWQWQPQTTLLVGYAYGQINYTADEPIGTRSDGSIITSSDRDLRSHYGYVGAEHHFNPQFTGSLKGGVVYTENYGDPVNSETDVGPYINLSLSYAYAPECSLTAGFTQDISSTDVVGAQGAGFARSSDSSVAYAELDHRLLPKLYSSLIGQFQHSTFNGGEFDNKSENYYLLGLTFTYKFNTHFSAQTGYNYDNLDSDIGRSFYKNRVFLGMNAAY